jgi:FkbM family methyltransferase
MNKLVTLHKFFSSHPLTHDSRLRAWMRFSSWQIRSRLREEIIVSWVGGQNLAVKRGMTGATGNIYVGLHEFSDMMFLLHFLRAGDLFLDVGANVGTYTVLAAGVCGATAWAFEPDPGTANHLKRNIEINNLQNAVQVHEMALGPSSGEIPFTVGLDTMNRVAVDQDRNVRMVRQRALDDVVAEHSPRFMKVDVEGYEEPFLKGALAVLAKSSLKAIELESVTPWMEQVLSEHDFERVYYHPFQRRVDQ